MGRKRSRGFGWVAEDAEGEAIERIERPSRSAAKRARRRLEELVERMVSLSAGQRRLLPLGEPALDALDALAQAGTKSDRRRKLLFATSQISGIDPDELDDAIAQIG